MKQAKFLLNQNIQLLQLLYPSIVTKQLTKRGLINFGGNVSKCLFGILNDNNGKKINLKIHV